MATWTVIPVAAACGIAVAVARYNRVPIFVMAAVGWLVFGMWAAVIGASYYAGLRFGRLAAAAVPRAVHGGDRHGGVHLRVVPAAGSGAARWSTSPRPSA